MKDQFVTYETALKLKELGFNEPCFGGFSISGDLDHNNFFISHDGYCFDKSVKQVCLAPLWQQAISFLLNSISKEDDSYLINCSFYSDNSGFIRDDNCIEIPFDSLKHCVLILLKWKKN